MKPLHFTILILAAALMFSMGCNSKKADAINEESSTVPKIETKDSASFVNAAGEENIVQHFICPNHCKGSGGPAEGKCPVCGTDYVHNAAFHKGSSIPEPAMKIDPVTHMAVPTHTEARNANGVYHFICPKGDPGGAGVAGKCPKCGAELVHNQAFHSN
ncbi:MAG: heavy metal-binding domain-containing protein [Saprospiraceae bacterium]